MWGLERFSGARNATWFDRRQCEAAFGVSWDTAKTSKTLRYSVGARVFGGGVDAIGIRLPSLDERVRHRLAVTIEDAPADNDMLARNLWPGDDRNEPWPQAYQEEWTNRL
jgi:hypothetical protein